jgi:drug/metabolite transporter (DMT)-like permease
LLFKGYKVGDLSVVYPVSRGLAPLLTTICAIFLFKENPTVIAFIGIICIIFGIFFLTGGMRAFRSKVNFLPVSYGVLIAMTISSYTLLDKAAVSVIMISPLILDYFNTLGRLYYLLQTL